MDRRPGYRLPERAARSPDNILRGDGTFWKENQKTIIMAETWCSRAASNIVERKKTFWDFLEDNPKKKNKRLGLCAASHNVEK